MEATSGGPSQQGDPQSNNAPSKMSSNGIMSKIFPVPEQFRSCGTCCVGALQSILSFMVMILMAAYSQHPHEIVEISDGTLTDETAQALSNLFIGLALASAVMVILSILIIFGAKTNRPKLLTPWLGYYSVILILYTLGILTQFFCLVTMEQYAVSIVTIIGGFITFYIGAYMINIVHSHYCDLRKLNF